MRQKIRNTDAESNSCKMRKMFLSFLFAVITVVNGLKKVTFVSMPSYTSLPYSLGFLSPAIDMALRHVTELYGNQLSFSIVTLNNSMVKTCGDVQAEVLPFWTKLHLDPSRPENRDHLFVMLSAPCADAVGLLGDLAREYRIPLVTSGGSDAYLDSRTRFPTLLRFSPYKILELAGVTGSLLIYHGWSDVAVICDDGATEMNVYPLLCRTVPAYLQQLDRVQSVTNIHYNFRTTDHSRFLSEASHYTRIFVVITHGIRLRQLLIAAQKLGMAHGENAFIAFEAFKSPTSFGKLSWNYGDNDDMIAKQAYEYLLIIIVFPLETDGSVAIYSTMKSQSEKLYGSKYDKDEPVNPFVTGIYLGMFVISQVIYESVGVLTDIASNISKHYHANLASAAWNRQFATPVGTVFLDKNGDMEHDYGVKSMVPNTEDFQVVFIWDKKSKRVTSFEERRVVWPENQTAPVNKPFCGFTGNDPQCNIRTGYFRNMIMLVIAVLIGTAGSTAGAISCHRRHHLQNDMSWIIPVNEIKIMDCLFKGMSRLYSLDNETTQAHDKVRTIKTGQIARYRATDVWIRRVISANQERSKMAPSSVAAINLRVHFRNNNVATFLGVCYEPFHAWLVSEYFAKGSLDALITYKQASIDRTLQFSILLEIAKGLQSIHQSFIRFHGSLKSTNCMVTSQLGIKLTDFGTSSLYEENGIITWIKKGCYEKLLWTSPEILRNPLHKPTREGDLYSFGIITYEVMLLTWPYRPQLIQPDKKQMNSEEIIAAVTAFSSPPFRPRYPQLGHISSDIRALMEHCWTENPYQRWNMAKAITLLETQMGGKQAFSYMESVLQRLQSYADNLELQVSDRTQELLAEKNKSEEVLRNMLPTMVADALIRGASVLPEAFASATIAFTGIWDFNELITVSSSLHVVALLNDLYTEMDSLLPCFDVYKVETIKDSYMLASGVPKRNGNSHASAVGSLCCAIIEITKTQQFAHRNVQLHIGMHTGPVAAGIIGKKMVRYCLFGDTVNVASRMTSTAEATRIQISESTKDVLDQCKNFTCKPRGEIFVKGKGLMQTFWLEVDANAG